ncbi:response regulator [Occultella kanbiaonis]|uniref:response regulator n=1 Tax=Occultella kanbiaonis TaxID=2675754 RepID=UPI0012B6BC02|nr:response regulator transcription factor [Occultella kanbiaonis]
MTGIDPGGTAADRAVRVLIVDDEAMIRAGIRAVLASDPTIEVVDEAADGRAGVDLTRRRRPDVVLMDIRMPLLDGLMACREIVGLGQGARVVMLTTFGEDSYIAEALEGGASGFLLKASDPRELVTAVHAVADGAAYLSPRVARRVIDRLRIAGAPAAADDRARLAVLTERESDVLALLAAGSSNAQVGRELHLTEGTVKGYVSAILVKLGVENRVQAAILAHRAGLVPPT